MHSKKEKLSLLENIYIVDLIKKRKKYEKTKSLKNSIDLVISIEKLITLDYNNWQLIYTYVGFVLLEDHQEFLIDNRIKLYLYYDRCFDFIKQSSKI